MWSNILTNISMIKRGKDTVESYHYSKEKKFTLLREAKLLSRYEQTKLEVD